MKDWYCLYKEEALAKDLDLLCDIYLLHERQERETEQGHVTYSIKGQTFAKDASGGEYHLLEDGSVGYHSSEGETGRIAESVEELFNFLVQCPCWFDYCHVLDHTNEESLEAYGQSVRNMHREEYEEDLEDDSQEPYDVLWKRVALGLEIEIEDTTAPTLTQFRLAATRAPRYQSYYQEKNGTVTRSMEILCETSMANDAI